MLTRAFYAALAAALRDTGRTGRFFIAVGAGDPAWDRAPPREDRDVGGLAAELARVPVPPEGMVFLDARGRPSGEPTHRLALSATFAAGEGVGTLRECGLFGGGATSDAGSGTLLSYFAHPRIEKAGEGVLTRTVHVDLEPRPFVPGSRETRFLGNTFTTELHDLDNRQPGCQIGEIRFDRRYYFPTVEDAVAAGYDLCAYCFGRSRSRR